MSNASNLSPESAQQAGEKLRRLEEQISSVVLGQSEAVEQMLVSLLAGGHALIEGVPGTAKTLAIRTLTRCVDAKYSRIQFTPDLMPTDVTGVNVLNEVKREFEFRPGPIFADILLADEINRAPAKTQSSLLEAMAESQVTVDGTTHPLSKLFTVFATQNPVEYEGTYPLPEAQLDRFLLKISVDYPSEETEVGILDRYAEGFDSAEPESFGVEAQLSSQDLIDMRQMTRHVRVEPELRSYITALVRRTRQDANLFLGASPRAVVALFRASQAKALLEGRDYVTPDDVKELAIAILRHRVILAPEAQVDGISADSRIEGAIAAVPAPK